MHLPDSSGWQFVFCKCFYAPKVNIRSAQLNRGPLREPWPVGLLRGTQTQLFNAVLAT